MSPAEHVRVVLLEARRRGLQFPEAWLLALQTLPRPKDPASREERLQWLAELAWARPFYWCAYVGRPFADRDLLAAGDRLVLAAVIVDEDIVAVAIVDVAVAA